MNSAFLDLRRVRYIVTIAESGSISAAARSLNVAQPALSYHLAEMEKALGVALFERSATGMTPTVPGLLFVEHGRIILDAVAVAENDIRRQVKTKTVQEVVRLTIIPSLAAVMLPRLIAAFREHMPDKVLRVIDARTLFADELIDSGKADVAIKLPLTETFQETPIVWEPLYCIMRNNGTRGPIAFRDVAALPLVLPAKENPLRKFLELAAQKEGLSLNVIMDVDGFEPRREVVLSGYGVTVFGGLGIPHDQMGSDLLARQIVEPELKHPLILRSREGLDPALDKAIREILAEVFRNWS
ncbi:MULTISPECIES: LysR family transcriptional regulator [unclassified Rhizobium]|uniref:LysR family transcriptional regulator n=1 Tax=Rhizobium sp. BG4 TaxID=2613770 RepID=UPI0010299F42|nr:LysR family transcriptional regulator [Rhizobium sp. BG4]QRM46881.1 LysR family transcriptional regulator [Rhizobium sp. BG4]